MSDPAQDDNGFGWTADFDSAVIPDPVDVSSISNKVTSEPPKSETHTPSELSWPRPGVTNDETTSRPHVNGLPDSFDTVKDGASTGQETSSSKEIKTVCPQTASCGSDPLKFEPKNEIKQVLSTEEISSVFKDAFKHQIISNQSSSSSSPLSVSCDSKLNVDCPSSLNLGNDVNGKEWNSLVKLFTTHLCNDTVWKELQSKEGMQSMKIKKWKSSHSFEMFLKALNIDPSQTIRDDVPIFASGLGLLEPVKSCDTPVASRTTEAIVMEPSVITPSLPTTSAPSSFVTPSPNSTSVSDIKMQPNSTETVNWGPQAEVSNRPSSSLVRDDIQNPNECKPCPILSTNLLPSQQLNLNPETLIVPVHFNGAVTKSFGTNDTISSGDKELSSEHQGIKCKEQQHDPEEEIGGGSDRILKTGTFNYQRDLIYNNQCPSSDVQGREVPLGLSNQNDGCKGNHCPSSDHQPFHSSLPASPSTPRNESLPILAFLSNHIQPN